MPWLLLISPRASHRVQRKPIQEALCLQPGSHQDSEGTEISLTQSNDTFNDTAPLHSVEAYVSAQAPISSCTMAHDNGVTTCAVCYDDAPHVEMPCCGRDGATVGYCRGCIEILCRQYQGIGRCPTCRKYISVDAEGRVFLTTRTGPCDMCRQTRTIIDRNMCDACLLGCQHPLRYECDQCHRTQRIPHPMWRYQPTPSEFGGATWACHQGCGDFTHWRVLEVDRERVPVEDAPEGWGLRDAWFARVRSARELQQQ